MRLAAIFITAVVSMALCLHPQGTAAPAKAKKSTKKKRRTVPRPPAVSAAMKAQAQETVNENLAREIAIENPGALVPFFEMLYRQQKGVSEGPLHILHYGDSHTAADDWTGWIRGLLQARFGDGGEGYSFAGRPFLGYRRINLRSGESRGWRSEGLLRAGDGLNGLGGVSIATRMPRETIYLEAECRRLELYYWRQPGGGSLRLSEDGQTVETISTDGDAGPGYFERKMAPGVHRFELTTLERAPVRLFGWVTENEKGITYESMGINGAQASVIFNWDENLLASHVSRRNPALIVFAYGTNEAGNRDWTRESYAEMFSTLIQRFRKAAPTASILVIGPPDRFSRVKGRWVPYENVDRIVDAQRAAAAANGCAFWDLRGRMGGKGSMRNWMLAGLAQYDHVHFTRSGYQLLGEVLTKDLMAQYEVFSKAREQLAKQVMDGQTNQDH
jgi:lysophospholipase L1-like esterase